MGSLVSGLSAEHRGRSLAHSKASICPGLSVVLEHLYLSICYNLGSWDPTEILRTCVCRTASQVHWVSGAAFCKGFCPPGDCSLQRPQDWGSSLSSHLFPRGVLNPQVSTTALWLLPSQSNCHFVIEFLDLGTVCNFMDQRF